MDLYNTGTVETAETAEIHAVLPGKRGLDCIFYRFFEYKTCPLREEAYIVLEVPPGGVSPPWAGGALPGSGALGLPNGRSIPPGGLQGKYLRGRAGVGGYV